MVCRDNNHYPRCREHFLTPSTRRHTHPFGGLGVKGLQERLVLWKHALRNSLIPLLTFSGISLAGLLNGALVVEVVFGWPGIGRMLLDGVQQRNFPVVQAAVLASGFS